MNNVVLNVAIIGCGNRGCDSYGEEMRKRPEMFKIVALCDINEDLLHRRAAHFNVEKENLFTNEEDFFEKKRADVCVIATQDRDHVRHAIAAMKLGYDILLEKPISDNKEECYELLKVQKETGAKAMVCHVLRFASLFVKAKEIIDSGEIGKLIEIQHLEQVASWHQAHSYVRGNWRNDKYTHPMILAKCCHDLDLLCWYTGSKCKSLSSVGGLSYLRKENQPKDAADRCLDCKYQDTCGWSAKKIYYTSWLKKGQPKNVWPQSVILNYKEETPEAILSALKEGPYGRCVFACDNNVVDHQDVMMTFENGVKATLTMTGFTKNGGRIIRFHGTDGELDLDTDAKSIKVGRYEEGEYTITEEDIAKSNVAAAAASGGHGGGDGGIVESLYRYIALNEENKTSFELSIESHLMGIAAEESRLKDGERIVIEHR